MFRQRALPEVRGPAEGAEVASSSAVRTRGRSQLPELLPFLATMRWLRAQSAVAAVRTCLLENVQDLDVMHDFLKWIHSEDEKCQLVIKGRVKSDRKESLYSILIKNIIAVEKLEERCFNRKNMFQILSVDRPERPLYVQGSNCVEANEWIEIITRLSRCNHKRLHVYHPCAFLSGSWMCCKNTDEKAVGCTSCTGGSPANIQLAIDCDREAERIFSLFQANLPRLQKMEDACGSIDVYQGPQEQDESAHFTIQDSRVTFKTLQQITGVVKELDKFHEKYRIKRSTRAKYGSEENPIGAK